MCPRHDKVMASGATSSTQSVASMKDSSTPRSSDFAVCRGWLSIRSVWNAIVIMIGARQGASGPLARTTTASFRAGRVAPHQSIVIGFRHVWRDDPMTGGISIVPTSALPPTFIISAKKIALKLSGSGLAEPPRRTVRLSSILCLGGASASGLLSTYWCFRAIGNPLPRTPV